ncbi:MAG: nicotine dehydrogenase medium subunit [Alphaproteobacteria bacterium]|nr:nicotine dehydrogenase medium subunit [Alphaproteobacteria bacterium]
MKFPTFAYAAPETLDEAVDLLAEDPDARALAGGQSLMPIMALRMAAPTMLVDLDRVSGLKSSVAGEESLRIGAMVTHAENARSFDIWARLPLISRALHHVAHQAVRNRGTFGGSLAHADAGAEMPLVVAALDGTMLLRGQGYERAVAAPDFFLGHYTTAIEPGELLVAVDLPYTQLIWAFEEVARRRGYLALAMAAVGVRIEDNACVEARVMLGGVSDRPVSAPAAEAYLVGRELSEAAAREAGRLSADGLDARSDTNADAAYRRSVIAVLVRRAIMRLARGEI